MRKFFSVLKKIRWYKILILCIFWLFVVAFSSIMTSDVVLSALENSNIEFQGIPFVLLWKFFMFNNVCLALFVVLPFFIHFLLIDWCKKDLKNESEKNKKEC